MAHDNDLSTDQAGLVWAIPVRPDLLGGQLSVYKNVLPTIHVLRLCHRFGNGPEAHITKLPVEIAQIIENFIMENASPASAKWEESFRHFEHRCEPSEHIDDDFYFDPVWEEACERTVDEVCEQWKATGCVSCESKLDEAINHIFCDDGMWEDEDDHGFASCKTASSQWVKLINQDVGGRFVKYDKILRRHFGLKAHLFTTRLDPVAWPDHPNHHWHTTELQTTICYLTLASGSILKTAYEPSSDEVIEGSINIKGAQSHLVELPDLANKDSMVKQFRRALRLLQLEPYVHPSQLPSTLSPNHLHQNLVQTDRDSNDVNGMKEKNEFVTIDLSSI